MLIIGFFLFTLAVHFLVPVPTLARALLVDCNGNGDFTTIQAAVDVSSSGDTLLLAGCAFEESVTIPVPLVLIGQGPGLSKITWAGPEPTVSSGDFDISLKRLAVIGGDRAIVWGDYQLQLEDCSITGQAYARGGLAHVEIVRSTVSSLFVRGGSYISRIVDSEIESVFIAGVFLSHGHLLESSNSTFGSVRFGNLAGQTSEGDQIRSIHLLGGLDVYNALTATGSTVDSCIARQSPQLTLNGCTLGIVEYEDYASIGSEVFMNNCLVLGDFSVFPYSYGSLSEAGVPGLQSLGFAIEHNTFVASFHFEHDTILPVAIRSNVFASPASLTSHSDQVTVTYNIFQSGYLFDLPYAEYYPNIEADPQFCDAQSGDYSVHETSLCLGNAHDGGDIGAFGVGCGPVDVRNTTWGRLKVLFQQKPSN